MKTMKTAMPLVLLALSAFAADAQQIHRCDDGAGRIAYQDRACATERTSAPMAAEPVHYERSDYGKGDWTHEQSRARRLQVKLDAPNERVRVQALLRPARDRETAQQAANGRSCQDTLRVATMCGQFTGMYACDGRGFVRRTALDAGISPSPTISNGDAFLIERCIVHATRGGRAGIGAVAAP